MFLFRNGRRLVLKTRLRHQQKTPQGQAGFSLSWNWVRLLLASGAIYGGNRLTSKLYR